MISLNDINSKAIVEGVDKGLIEDSSRNTSFGEVEFCYTESGFNIYSESLGMELFYNNSGRLAGAEIKLCDFCVGEYDEDLESETMGDKSSELMDVWLQLKDSQLEVHFDFEENKVIIVSADNNTSESTVLDTYCDADIFSLNEPTKFCFEGYTLNLIYWVFEDEFYFGVYTTVNGEDFTQEMITMYVKSGCDCNYKTYLDGNSSDRYEKLAKKVFLKLGEGMTGDKLLPGNGGLS